jgi:hypothetical protein
VKEAAPVTIENNRSMMSLFPVLAFIYPDQRTRKKTLSFALDLLARNTTGQTKGRA